MIEPEGRGGSLAGTLVAISVAVPTVLGASPVTLALVGLGLGPAAWVAVAWQLASVVTWALLSVPLLRLLRRRTDANVAVGEPALTLTRDGAGLWPLILLALICHAGVLAVASEILALGRGRPALPLLAADLLLLYAPMNVMTVIGLIAATVVGAEHRARLAEHTLRRGLERQLVDAQHQVLATLAELNGPSPTVRPAAPARYRDRLTVTTGNRTTVVAVDEIDWIEARSYYARLHVGERSHLLRRSMDALEEQLDPARFARIHRSTIVQLDRVLELQPFDRRSYVVTLRDGTRLLMSRRRRRLLDYLQP